MNKLHPNNLCIYNALVNLRNKKSFKPIIFNFFSEKKDDFSIFLNLKKFILASQVSQNFLFLKLSLVFSSVYLFSSRDFLNLDIESFFPFRSDYLFRYQSFD